MSENYILSTKTLTHLIATMFSHAELKQQIATAIDKAESENKPVDTYLQDFLPDRLQGWLEHTYPTLEINEYIRLQYRSINKQRETFEALYMQLQEALRYGEALSFYMHEWRDLETADDLARVQVDKTRRCAHCNEEFEAVNSMQKYCSGACQKKAGMKRYRAKRK